MAVNDRFMSNGQKSIEDRVQHKKNHLASSDLAQYMVTDSS